jgi:hypothetical protein
LEGLDAGGMMILRWIIKLGINWIHLAQDCDRCSFLVNTSLNLRIP